MAIRMSGSMINGTISHLINQPAVSYYFGKGHAHGWVDMKLSETSADLELYCINSTHTQHGDRRQIRFKDKKK